MYVNIQQERRLPAAKSETHMMSDLNLKQYYIMDSGLLFRWLWWSVALVEYALG